MNFHKEVVPYLEKQSGESLDETDKKMFLNRWRTFETLSGVRRLIEEEFTTSVLEIFDFSCDLY
jgi:hypothetical protein